MPLWGVATGKSKRCVARSKRSGARCKNPAVAAASWGRSWNVCRMHGAKQSSAIKRGADHPQYKHGFETRDAKAERSKRLAELRDLESLAYACQLVVGPKWRGRKPKS